MLETLKELIVSTFIAVFALFPSLSLTPQKQAEVQLASYEVSQLLESIEATCAGKEKACFSGKIEEITKTHGPKAALEALVLVYEQRLLLPESVDDHQMAHEIGRFTSRHFGMKSEAFLMCGTEFNYGCQHGFFEEALGKTGSAEKATELICGPLEESSEYSSKFKFYCYHGVGHGVLMAAAYDLESALQTCDSLPTDTSSAGCWQGVFMENVNGGVRGETRSGIFSDTDPLLPCSVVAERHKHECFINHAGWLMHYFKNDVAGATGACLKAPENNISACLQSIGLMVTNPTWQGPLGGEGGDFINIAWMLCSKFPEGYRHECVRGGVENLLNFDETDISRARAFCDTALPHREMCYERMGASLRHQTAGNSSAHTICDTLGPEPALWCHNGVNL